MGSGSFLNRRSRELPKRVEYLFLPVLAISAATCVIYSFLNFFLTMEHTWLSIDEEVVDLWIPMVLSAILVLPIIGRRLRALELSEKHNIRFLYASIAVAAVAVPLIVTQSYLRKTTGHLTHLTSAAQVGSVASSKFYAFDTLCLDRDRALVRPAAELAGRRRDNLVFYLYVATPVCGDSASVDRNPVWVGFVFRKIISNSLPEAQKDLEFQAFARTSETDFRTSDRHYPFFERLGHNKDALNFRKTLQKFGASADGTVLIPHTESFDQKGGDRLSWAWKSFATLNAFWLALILVPTMKPVELTQPHGKRDAAGFFVHLLIPNKGTFGLPLLIDINLAVYLCMVFAGLGVTSFQGDDLRNWGANYGPDIHDFGIYRLVSSEFVHGGLMHLANNMYGLFLAGVFLAPVISNWSLIVSYLVCGLGGSVASHVWNPSGLSVGASGAIMGLWGMLLLLVALKDDRINAASRLIGVNAVIFVGLTLVMGFTGHGIDNAAHVGGLLTGALLGAVMAASRRSRTPRTMQAAD